MRHPQKDKIRVTKTIDQLGNVPNNARQTDRKIPDVTIISDSQSSQAEEPPLTDNTDTEITVTADIKYNTNNTDETVAKSEESQTPEILPPVSCSTELAQHRFNKDPDQTPTRSPQKGSNSVNKGVVEFNIEVEENKPKIVEGGKGSVYPIESKTQKELIKWVASNIFDNFRTILDPKPKSQKRIVHFIRNTANKQKAGNKNA